MSLSRKWSIEHVGDAPHERKKRRPEGWNGNNLGSDERLSHSYVVTISLVLDP